MKPTRRSFLLLAGGATALAAAAAATKTVTSVTNASGAKTKPANAGYELTAHIRNYYRTASI
jgi:hypothetical protein